MFMFKNKGEMEILKRKRTTGESHIDNGVLIAAITGAGAIQPSRFIDHMQRHTTSGNATLQLEMPPTNAASTTEDSVGVSKDDANEAASVGGLFGCNGSLGFNVRSPDMPYAETRDGREAAATTGVGPPEQQAPQPIPKPLSASILSPAAPQNRWCSSNPGPDLSNVDDQHGGDFKSHQPMEQANMQQCNNAALITQADHRPLDQPPSQPRPPLSMHPQDSTLLPQQPIVQAPTGPVDPFSADAVRQLIDTKFQEVGRELHELKSCVIRLNGAINQSISHLTLNSTY